MGCQVAAGGDKRGAVLRASQRARRWRNGFMTMVGCGIRRPAGPRATLKPREDWSSRQPRPAVEKGDWTFRAPTRRYVPNSPEVLSPFSTAASPRCVTWIHEFTVTWAKIGCDVSCGKMSKIFFSQGATPSKYLEMEFRSRILTLCPNWNSLLACWIPDGITAVNTRDAGRRHHKGGRPCLRAALLFQRSLFAASPIRYSTITMEWSVISCSWQRQKCRRACRRTRTRECQTFGARSIKKFARAFKKPTDSSI